ncbi:hypothetical protein ABPG74_013341 [Tetrahymena malaccensis]
MFYYSQSLILSELANHQEQANLDLEDQEDFENTSIIFELSQSYIQNDNNQHEQNNVANNQHIQDFIPQAGNGNQENNLNANNGNQLDNLYDAQNQQNPHINQQNIIANLNNLGLFYLVVNRWLSNLADPVLLILFFLTGFVNSQSISGDWANVLRYCNFIVGACCVITNLINVLRLIKGKREQILLPLPQNPPQEEVRNAYSQEKLQQNFNNFYFVCLIAISIVQVVLMIQNNKYEDNIYQRYLLLVFIYLRVVMYLIFYLNKHPKTIKKLLMYCVSSWPVYRKEFDEYIYYNFDFAVQIQTTFAKDPVQNYLKFMIYIYEFILVLQIIAFGSSWQKHQLILQEYSYFFGGFYYLSIIYIALFNYYIVTQNIQLSSKMNRVKNSAFLIVFFSSYNIFIILQLLSALLQESGKEYYILQFEPIFSFYLVCISTRIVLNRITLKTLNQEIQKQQKLQLVENQQQISIQQQNNNNLDIEIPQANQQVNVIQLNRSNNSNIFMQQSQQISSSYQNINNNQNIQIDQVSNQSINNQNVSNNINQIANQQNPNANNINNNIRNQEEQINHFQETKRKIRLMVNNYQESLDKNINLIVNFEGYTITISLALQLFVYMFSDNLEIYEQNSTLCNIYYFLSIYSFMFYFLSSKKVSLAYDKLKNSSEPISLYWIIPFQSYLNKLGWYLSWILSFLLIYLYYNINFTNNSFVKAEYIFMIFFSITTFFIFQGIHLVRRIIQSKNIN